MEISSFNKIAVTTPNSELSIDSISWSLKGRAQQHLNLCTGYHPLPSYPFTLQTVVTRQHVRLHHHTAFISRLQTDIHQSLYIPLHPNKQQLRHFLSSHPKTKENNDTAGTPSAITAPASSSFDTLICALSQQA